MWLEECRQVGIDSFLFSGYPHLDRFRELVMPNLPLGHPIPSREISIDAGPFGEATAGDHRSKFKASQS